MKKGYCDITFILDRSGSMSSIRNDTIGGFNSFVDEQKKVAGEATVTLVQFDDRYQIDYALVPINDVKRLTTETFVPRGSTAMNDAIGRTIISTGDRLAAMPESERPEKVIFVIMTDGEENCSKIYNRQQVKDMVEHQKSKYSWDFVFLGANIDAEAVGKTFGIYEGCSMTYGATSVGTQYAFTTMSKGLAAHRSMDTVALASAKVGGDYKFFADEDKAQVVDTTIPDVFIDPNFIGFATSTMSTADYTTK